MWKRRIAELVISAAVFVVGASIVLGIDFGATTGCTNQLVDPGNCGRAGWATVPALVTLVVLVVYVIYGKRINPYAKPISLIGVIVFVVGAQTLATILLLR